MEKGLLLRKGLLGVFVLFLAFPYLHLLWKSPQLNFVWDPYLLPVITGAGLQSVLSAFFTLLLGLIGAFGLLAIESRLPKLTFRTFCFLLIIPSFLPPLYVVLLCTQAMGALPTGLWSVVFFHSLMNVGLVSYLFFGIFQRKLARWWKEAQVLGASSTYFAIRVLPRVLHNDFISLGFFFVVLYFFSFSIPLLVGGARYGGIEVFIYDKILNYGAWGEALQLSIGFFLLLLLVTVVMRDRRLRDFVGEESSEEISLRALGRSGLAIVPVLPIVFLAYGFLQVLTVGKNWTSFASNAEGWRVSTSIGLTAGLFTFVLLSVLAFIFSNRILRRILISLINPGWVVVAFSFLLLPGDQPIWLMAKLMMALSVLYLPYLFRLSFQQSLRDLQKQVNVAQTFPVSWWQIYSQVVWPQCFATICFLSGLAGVWASGDFAVSGIILSGSLSSPLAVEMKNLLSTYRLGEAQLKLIPLLLVSFFVFFVYQGLYYVGRRTFSSRA